MNLGLLFLKRIDKQGWFRNIVTIFAITLATTVLLSAMTLGNIISSVNTRTDWLSQVAYNGNYYADKNPKFEKNHLLISMNRTEFEKLSIKEVGLRQISPEAPLLHGLTRAPEDKEMFISRGLEKAIQDNPLLKERYDGYKLTVNIPNELLATPNERISIYRISDEALANNSQSFRYVTKENLDSEAKGDMHRAMTLIVNTFMALCGIGFCFPLLVLVISATRVGMVQREKRYAALSLIGVSKKQINRIILAETLAVSIIAILLGSLLYIAVKYLFFANFAMYENDVPFLSDITIKPSVYFGVIGLIFAIIIFVNYIALNKVKTSPLGVIKNQKKLRRPTFLGLLPLVIAGLSIWKINSLGFEWLSENNGMNMIYYAVVFLIAMIGLLTSGPFFTYIVSKLMNLFSHKASTVMASKRMQVFSRPIFSSVSGVVLALFVGSFFITTVESAKKSFEKYYESYSIETQLSNKSNKKNTLRYTTFNNRLDQIVKKAQSNPDFSKNLIGTVNQKRFLETSVNDDGTKAPMNGELYTCEDLPKITQLNCPKEYKENDEVVVWNNIAERKKEITLLTKDLKEKGKIIEQVSVVFVFNPSVNMKKMLVILQNITASELYRTGSSGKIYTSDDSFDVFQSIDEFIKLIEIGTVITIIIAGFSLAVATIGAFFERKKSFFSLRLMGTELKTLNRVVIIESAVPLILASITAIISGILTSRYLSEAMSAHYIFAVPGIGYFITVLVSIIATIGIIVAILPLLKKITSFEENRTE